MGTRDITAFDERFFEKALKDHAKGEIIEVLEVKNNCITAKGTNFLSDLFKSSVRYAVTSKDGKSRSEHWTDVMIKTEPLTLGNMAAMVREQELFRTEIRVLRDVLPRVEGLVGSQIGPKLIYASESNSATLVMEDLTKKGFVMKDRQRGLSLDHCVLVIKQMAKLHAGSVAAFEEHPTVIKSFDGGILSAKCPSSYIRLVEVSLSNIRKEIENWKDENYVQIAKKLSKLAERTNSECNDVYSYDADEFCVLNHGDCWVNNIMFKENQQGEPIDLRMVDYQMSVYTSPVIDLLYFLNICPEHSIKYDKDDFFLETYLTTLNSTMKRLGCKTKPPTMGQLKASMHKKRFYAIFAGLVLYLRMIANKEDTEDFEDLLIKMAGETKMNVFKNPFAVRAARKMITVLDERGYFD